MSLLSIWYCDFLNAVSLNTNLEYAKGIYGTCVISKSVNWIFCLIDSRFLDIVLIKVSCLFQFFKWEQSCTLYHSLKPVLIWSCLLFEVTAINALRTLTAFGKILPESVQFSMSVNQHVGEIRYIFFFRCSVFLIKIHPFFVFVKKYRRQLKQN